MPTSTLPPSGVCNVTQTLRPCAEASRPTSRPTALDWRTICCCAVLRLAVSGGGAVVFKLPENGVTTSLSYADVKRLAKVFRFACGSLRMARGIGSWSVLNMLFPLLPPEVAFAGNGDMAELARSIPTRLKVGAPCPFFLHLRLPRSATWHGKTAAIVSRYWDNDRHALARAYRVGAGLHYTLRRVDNGGNIFGAVVAGWTWNAVSRAGPWSPYVTGTTLVIRLTGCCMVDHAVSRRPLDLRLASLRHFWKYV